MLVYQRVFHYFFGETYWNIRMWMITGVPLWLDGKSHMGPKLWNEHMTGGIKIQLCQLFLDGLGTRVLTHNHRPAKTKGTHGSASYAFWGLLGAWSIHNIGAPNFDPIFLLTLNHVFFAIGRGACDATSCINYTVGSGFWPLAPFRFRRKPYIPKGKSNLAAGPE